MLLPEVEWVGISRVERMQITVELRLRRFALCTQDEPQSTAVVLVRLVVNAYTFVWRWLIDSSCGLPGVR